jgi:hypothetical protein
VSPSRIDDHSLQALKRSSSSAVTTSSSRLSRLSKLVNEALVGSEDYLLKVHSEFRKVAKDQRVYRTLVTKILGFCTMIDNAASNITNSSYCRHDPAHDITVAISALPSQNGAARYIAVKLENESIQ